MQSLVHEGYNLKAICRKSVKNFCKKVEKSNKANVKKVNGKKENILYGLEMKNALIESVTIGRHYGL